MNILQKAFARLLVAGLLGLGLAAVPAASASASTDEVTLDTVYTASYYKLENLLGVVPDSYTQPVSETSSNEGWIGKENGVLVFASYAPGETVVFEYTVDNVVATAKVPAYSQTPTTYKKLANRKVRFDDNYAHKILIKWSPATCDKKGGKKIIEFGDSGVIRFNCRYIDVRVAVRHKGKWRWQEYFLVEKVRMN